MFDLLSISKNLNVLISDFDGVFTDNKVYIDSSGNEMIVCSKTDSLGLDFYKESRSAGISSFDFIVVSTETNPVVKTRCNKLNLECHSGVQDKKQFLLNKYNMYLDSSGTLDGFLYLGNDINDLGAIRICQYSAAPADAHPAILKEVDYVSQYSGGNGFIRDVLSKLLS